MAELLLKNVRKHFGEVIAVDDLNLKVPNCQFVTLLGPSGCGKTTTLNLIAGLEELTDGKIVKDGEDISAWPPNRRSMAMVFQSYALYPHMSVFDNIAFGLKIAKVPNSEIVARVNQVAEILQIKDLLDRRPRKLSGGQQQRVAVGRAIARKPDIFLMDEPLSNLDAKLRVRMRFELKRLHHEQKATTIYVTHDQAEAMTMSDYIAILQEGLLQQFGTPTEIYNKPNNLFVAGFIGSPPMNLVKGNWGFHNGKTILYTDGGHQLTLSDRFGQILEISSAPSSIVLGIRSEDIKVVAADGKASFYAVIEVVETMGSDDFLNVRVDDSIIIARVEPGQDYTRGESVGIKFREDRLHVFDPIKGDRRPLSELAAQT